MTASTRAPFTAEWPEQGQWTYEDWLHLPNDGTRYEIIDGVLYMTPAPSIMHQFSSMALSTALNNYVNAHGLGYVLAAPTDVLLPNYPVPFEPDLLFISEARKSIIRTQRIEGAPDLVIEILSPSNWPYDRNEKFRVYQEAGVPEYWIVDYRARTIEVFVLEDEEYTIIGKWGVGTTATSRVLAGFELPISAVFRDL